jgi:hypothetical protein
VRLFALTITLLVPALLRGGSFTSLVSVTCGGQTVSAPSGEVTCYAPDLPERGQARIDFTGLISGMDAIAWFDDYRQPNPGSASAWIRASYEVTFFGADGPGFLTASFCTAGGPGAVSSLGSLITPNGSIVLHGADRHMICNPADSSIPIVFGQTLDVQFTLDAESWGYNLGQTYIGFSGFQVFDANMHPVTWTADVVIPEPPAWQLGITGLTLLLAGSRFIRRSSTSAAAAPRTSPS